MSLAAAYMFGRKQVNEIIWDLSNAVYNGVFFNSNLGDTRAFYFSEIGDKMYIVDRSTNIIYQYSLTTNFDLTTAVYDSITKNISSQSNDTRGLYFSPDGLRMYAMPQTNDNVYQFSLTTAWNVSTASYDNKSLLVRPQESSPACLRFKPDGTKMYVAGLSDRLFEYTLSTPWDVSTGVYSAFKDLPTSVDTRGLAIKEDGTKLIIADALPVGTLSQYTFATPWDLSTLTSDNISFVSPGSPYDLYVSNDGTKIYTLDVNNKRVYEIDM